MVEENNKVNEHTQEEKTLMIQLLNTAVLPVPQAKTVIGIIEKSERSIVLLFYPTTKLNF